MPRACSGDPRERALDACGGGEGSRSEVARRCRVGERTLSGWLELAREEGRRHPEPRRGGTRPAGGEAATLAALVAGRNHATVAEYADLVAGRNDATLAEYADLLADRAGVRRGPSALRRALEALGPARKKRRPRPPSGIARTPRSASGRRRAGSGPRRGRRGAPGRPGSAPPA